ncbi:hypothetical protein [Pseudomonas sp. GM25]|uniref:hypothetical protein n=1 Tax=Pseudomonas sp. GM25 TaxID=1144327 RepID=UPI00027036A3|nr:hypothetical protein [Pseudomonas sp. GM25]EJM26844.1 hypothetical protein PMI24_03410 [Pseudomonas sp. GM25]
MAVALPEPDHLAGSVKRAKLLLAFAAQAGIPIPDDDLKAVLEAEQALEKGELKLDQEAAFWTSLSKLAVAVRPVTIASLQDTELVTGRSLIGLFTNRASKYVAWGSMATLLLILCVQVQAVQLSSRIQGFDDLVAKNKASNDSVFKLWGESQNAILVIKSLDPKTDVSDQNAAEAKGTAAYSAFAAAYYQNRAIKSARASAASLLDFSRTFWMATFFKEPPGTDKSPPNDTIPPMVSIYELTSLLGESVDEYRPRQQAQNQYDILYRLLLPALYGLLGSCVFVLRSVSSQLETFTFTWTRRLLGSARLALGPILGIASLVLIDPSKTDALSNLPQIGIALIAGYSVDLVLNFMDRITGAFGQPSSTQFPSGKP